MAQSLKGVEMEEQKMYKNRSFDDDPNFIRSGHLGIKKPEKMQQKLYWFEMKQDINNWVIQCGECAIAKPMQITPRAPLRDMQVGASLDRLTADILGSLISTTRRNSNVLINNKYGKKKTVNQNKMKPYFGDYYFNIDKEDKEHLNDIQQVLSLCILYVYMTTTFKDLQDHGLHFAEQRMAKKYYAIRTNPYFPLEGMDILKYDWDISAKQLGGRKSYPIQAPTPVKSHPSQVTTNRLVQQDVFDDICNIHSLLDMIDVDIMPQMLQQEG
ncbi:hypothetical protein CHS0354_016484 [Potamilus streckersoni]|uniref:Integrase zinc-binding domain-containing protein n=1 Tax=Potamilus streckersoni TaxID=2493646 RepID=A0AAE0WFT9_9BIVA|nr:hypothetical protein CHS0354_016484 [Potamilus streckersoni]